MVTPTHHQWKISFLSFLLCLSYTQGTRYSKQLTKQSVSTTLIQIDFTNVSQANDFIEKILHKINAEFSREFYSKLSDQK